MKLSKVLFDRVRVISFVALVSVGRDRNQTMVLFLWTLLGLPLVRIRVASIEVFNEVIDNF
jgi:hypothetical protein